jgi:Ca2+-binding EF-hand superfamily protein
MLLGKFYKTLFNGELMVESLRQQLAKRPLFSVHDAFKTLDTDEQGYITKEDFKRIFEEYGIFVTQKDVKSLVERCEYEMKGQG